MQCQLFRIWYVLYQDALPCIHVKDLEDEYDVHVDLNTAEAWESLKTVGDVVALIKELLAEKSANS